MVSSLWLVMLAGILLFLRASRYVLSRHKSDRPGWARHGNGRTDTGRISTQIVWTTAPLRDEDMAPSSTFEGKVCFFDSIEHRDMFEANHHLPVAEDMLQPRAWVLEQQGRRLGRSGTGDTWFGQSRSGAGGFADRDV